MRRDYRGREGTRELATEIVEGDLADIRECGAMIVMFDVPSVGTAMEVRFAAGEQGLPVFVVDVAKRELSPWLIYHATAILEGLEAACEAAGSVVWSQVRRHYQAAGPSPAGCL